MFNDTNFGDNVKSIRSNDFINEKIPIKDQIDLLKEDLLQVIYKNNYLIDIGWYPESDIKGSFLICIIKDYQWDKLIMQKKCKNFYSLNSYLKEFINIIQKQ